MAAPGLTVNHIQGSLIRCSAVAMVVGGLASCAASTDLALRIVGARYVPPDQFNAEVLTPTPPSNESSQTRFELAEMERIQANRSADDCAKADLDDKIDPQQFAGALGLPAVEKISSLPKLSLLLKRAHFLEAVMIDQAKKRFRRERPFAIDGRLLPCIPKPSDYSYPSGHASWAYMTAQILAKIAPERKDELLRRAGLYAERRVIGGVHYLSDIDAGRRAGEAIATMLFQSPSFLVEFNAAAAEMRAVHTVYHCADVLRCTSQ